MSIVVFKAGLLDTIQDEGRKGFQHHGVNPSGVMDVFSSRVANILVGNEWDEAVIELHFPASVFIFQEPALIAISGADMSATISGEPVPNNHPIWVNKNAILQFQKLVKGARAYLAVWGGFDIPQWLSSKSTNLKVQRGGFNGRALMKDDELPFRTIEGHVNKMKEADMHVLPWSADVAIPDNHDIFILRGAEWDRLSTASRENFMNHIFHVTPQSDRMGYQLDNIPLPVTEKEEIISTAVTAGTVQLLPNGKLIILMADHQTSGGYPRIAHVISAHLPRLAQYRSGDTIRFRLTDMANAEALYLEQSHHLRQLQHACNFRLENYIRKL